MVCILSFWKTLKAELTAKVLWSRAGNPFLEWLFVVAHQHFTESQEESSWEGSQEGSCSNFWIQTRAVLRISTFADSHSLTWLLLQCLIILVMIFSFLHQVRTIYEQVSYVMFRKNISRPILISQECPKIQEQQRMKQSSLLPPMGFWIVILLAWKIVPLRHVTKAEFKT